LIECIEFARLAPSAANLQPLEFVLVTKDIEFVFKNVVFSGYVKEGAPTDEEQAQAYIIVLSNQEINKDSKYDVGLAISNIILIAESKNIATCILGSIKRKQIRNHFQIPEKFNIDLIVALGKAAQKSYEEKLEEDIKYWLDDEGNIHVPKKKLEEHTS